MFLSFIFDNYFYQTMSEELNSRYVNIYYGESVQYTEDKIISCR